MGNTKQSGKKRTDKDAPAKERVYTEAEFEAECRALYDEYQQQVEQIVQRRYALELASRQVMHEMEYSGSKAPSAGDFSAYETRSDEILNYLRNGAASADGS